MSSKKHMERQAKVGAVLEEIRSMTASFPIAGEGFEPTFEDRANWLLLRLAPISEPRRDYMLETHKSRVPKDDSVMKRVGRKIKGSFRSVFVESRERRALRSELMRDENADLRQTTLQLGTIFGAHSAKSNAGFSVFDDIEAALDLIEGAHALVEPFAHQDASISKDILQQFVDQVNRSYKLDTPHSPVINDQAKPDNVVLVPGPQSR